MKLTRGPGDQSPSLRSKHQIPINVEGAKIFQGVLQTSLNLVYVLTKYINELLQNHLHVVVLLLLTMVVVVPLLLPLFHVSLPLKVEGNVVLVKVSCIFTSAFTQYVTSSLECSKVGCVSYQNILRFGQSQETEKKGVNISLTASLIWKLVRTEFQHQCPKATTAVVFYDKNEPLGTEGEKMGVLAFFEI